MGDNHPSSTLINSKGGDVEKLDRMDNCHSCQGGKMLIGIVVVLLLALAAVVSVTELRLRQAQEEQQDVNSRLMNRLDELESKLAACSCQSKPDEMNSRLAFHHGMALKLPSRDKRQVPLVTSPTEDDLNETQHIQNEHHGIASSHIALLYADPAELNKTGLSSTDQHSDVSFRNSTRKQPYCKSMLENGNRDLWCIPKFSRQKHKFMLQGRSTYYSYFAKAAWMSGEKAMENFDVTNNKERMLIVRKPGIYIVTTSMHFVNVTTGLIHYGVYARDSDLSRDSERSLGMCVSSVHPASNDGSEVYPCSTWQLSPLKAGDRVFLRINPFEWIRVQKETFFLALIKLNDYDL